MHRLSTVTSLDVSALAGHHAMPAALLLNNRRRNVLRLFLGAFRIKVSFLQRFWNNTRSAAFTMQDITQQVNEKRK